MRLLTLNCNTILFIVLIVCALYSKAQTINLIPDPSFEDQLPTTNYWTQLSLKHWKNLDTNTNLAGRSVYFSIGNTEPTARLPQDNNFFSVS